MLVLIFFLIALSAWGFPIPLCNLLTKKWKKKKKKLWLINFILTLCYNMHHFCGTLNTICQLNNCEKKKCLKFVHQCHFFILQILFQVKLQFSYLIYAWKRRCLKDIPLLTSNYILVLEFNLLRFYLGSAYFVEIENLLLKVL